MRRGIGILGVAGRMGQMLVAEARRVDLSIVGGCDRDGSTVGGCDRDGSTLPCGVTGFLTPEALAAACDVVIDFTHATTVRRHAEAVSLAGCAWIVGTTGLETADQAAVDAAASRVAVVQAANFSPGVTLLLETARRLAAALPAESYDAEILEMHHRQKVDAPSGTALALGQAVADGRGVALADARDSLRDGQTGARRTGAIGFAALRGGQVVGEHSVIFAGAHEHIILTHRAFDRAVFAAGAIRAAIWAAGQPPGRYGMPDVLGMTEAIHAPPM